MTGKVKYNGCSWCTGCTGYMDLPVRAPRCTTNWTQAGRLEAPSLHQLCNDNKLGANNTMKILWVCLLLATLLIVVQARGGRGGGGRGGGGWGGGRSRGGGYRGGSSSRSYGGSSSSRSLKKNLKKAAIVGAVAYGTYQVSDIFPSTPSIINL